MTGMTIETAIRIMSRWGMHVVRSERDAFTILDRSGLGTIEAE